MGVDTEKTNVDFVLLKYIKISNFVTPIITPFTNELFNGRI